MAIPTPETTEPVTVYFADWCPFSARLRSDLDKSDTPYTAIDVDNGDDKNEELNEWIKSVNDGNRIVPTVLYSDGTHATNPSADEVREKLEKLRS